MKVQVWGTYMGTYVFRIALMQEMGAYLSYLLPYIIGLKQYMFIFLRNKEKYALVLHV